VTVISVTTWIFDWVN